VRAFEAVVEATAALGARQPGADPRLYGVEVTRDLPYTDADDPDQRLDVYRPIDAARPLPVAIYLHGGGFRLLSKDTHWMAAIAMARRGYLVFVINYRLATRAPFPAALEDAAAAYAWVVRHAALHGGDPRDVTLAGESAGANLALGLGIAASYRRDEDYARRVFDLGVVPRAIVAGCGYLEVSNSARFFDKRAYPRVVREWVVDAVEGAYVGASEAANTEMADPLRVLERGERPERPFPAVIATVGSEDPILDDSVRLGRALRTLDVPHRIEVYEGEGHAFQLMTWRRQAKRAWRDAMGFVEAARARAAKWLAGQRPDHSWDGERGAVVETADAIADLSRCFRVLKPKKSAADKQASQLPPFDDADRDGTLMAMQRGALFLISLSEDGKWGAPGRPEAGLTAMAIGALEALPRPRPEDVQKVIDQGLAWLASLQDEDGAIHDGKLKNYITSASILALAASGEEKYAPVIEKARRFLIALQADEGEGYSEGDLYYGGIGYGDDERPDLSNLQMALEALAAAGTTPDDECFERALKFLERVQNRSESNDVRIEGEDGVVIHAGNDGGASYMPGESKAGFVVLSDGTKVPRSYGSMTYALLKGFVFAGLSKDDPRMVAAWDWVRKNYTLDVNPGFEESADPTASYQGLFYYFHTMAKALDLFGEEVIVDGAGVEHPWRKQLCGRLIAMQRKDDGSWINENAPRWWEGNPMLATSYALLTLGTAMPEER